MIETSNSEIKINRILCKRNFIKFVEEDKLVVSKVKLAKHFMVSKTTLLRWMRDNDYEHLIGKMYKKGDTK